MGRGTWTLTSPAWASRSTPPRRWRRRGRLEALARASGDAERATQRLGRGQPWQALATDAPRGDRGGAEPVAGLVESQKTATEGAHVLGRAMASAFDQAAFKGKGLRDVVAGLAEDLQRMALRDTVRGAVDGALGGGLLHGLGAALAGAFSFAGGGVMTREGPLPLRRYAGGGVADSPQLALFGDGPPARSLCAAARRPQHSGDRDGG